MSDKHKFNKLHRVGDEEYLLEKKQEEEAEKIASFAWGNKEERESNVDFSWAARDVDQCVRDVSNCVLKTIALEHFESTVLGHGSRFEILLKSDLHWLLRERFNDDYSLSSRVGMFDQIKKGISEHFEIDANEEKLNEKISSILPGETTRKSFALEAVALWDNAFSLDDEVDTVSVEISLKFKASE